MATDVLTTILRRVGPALSGDLLRKLEEHGLSPEAARQRLSRGAPDVGTLKGLTFPKRARFFYHVDDFPRERYWTALVEAVSVSSPAYGAAIGGLRAHDGVIPRHYFPIVCGAPIRQLKQVGVDAVLSRLTNVGLLKEEVVDELPCIALAASGWLGGRGEDVSSRLLVQQIMLLAVADWARKLNMGSYHKFAIRDLDKDLPTFGTHAFDLCAPSFLSPLTQHIPARGLKPGFLVCDAFVGNVDEFGIAAFLRKCAASKAMHKLPSFLPMLIADGYTKEAFDLARAKGIITATPFNLFGREIAEGLSALLQTLTHASAIAADNPGAVRDLFSKLGQIEGAAVNLRGALFELMVGHVVHQESQGSIDIGKKVRVSVEQSYEIDVFLASNSQVRVIECKGYGPNQQVGEDEIQKWIKEKVPKLRKTLSSEQRHQGCAFSFEFWTSGEYTPEAQKIMEDATAQINKYKMLFLDRDLVRKSITAAKLSGLGKVFDEHYAKHPLTKIDNQHNRSKRKTVNLPENEMTF